MSNGWRIELPGNYAEWFLGYTTSKICWYYVDIDKTKLEKQYFSSIWRKDLRHVFNLMRLNLLSELSKIQRYCRTMSNGWRIEISGNSAEWFLGYTTSKICWYVDITLISINQKLKKQYFSSIWRHNLKYNVDIILSNLSS